MHPDHERYVQACNYPGELDEAAVERHLAEYLKALGVERKIVRLPVGWSLEKFPALKSYIEEVLAEFVKRAPAARDAMAAMDARDGNALHRFACWCLQHYGYYWRFEISWIATTWLGAATPEVKGWSKPLFDAYIMGAWLLHWTKDTLFWVAKPKVHVERVNPTTRRLHCEDGPTLESDIENLYFWHGVLVPAFVVTRPDWITLDHIRNESNLEVQRIMIERFGAGKYLVETKAQLLDMDSLTLIGSAPRMLVEDEKGNRWLCGTDGSTGRCYTMAVPREATTCSEAHRMISGLDSEARLVAEA